MILPDKMQPMMHALQIQFSLTQLITAVIGGVYAVVICAILSKTSVGNDMIWKK